MELIVELIRVYCKGGTEIYRSAGMCHSYDTTIITIESLQIVIVNVSVITCTPALIHSL